ncbi:MAG: hypothetical protein COA45_02075 [Zetaproteobacteria bacterium]|nr:MAG: hypothetical protein COA45_02075 [Zetaproteobacteria bacterium]
MISCTLDPEDKKLFGKEIGEILVKNHGQKKFYSPAQVKKASSQSKYDVDWYCWAMCLYTSPDDFNTYHQSTGEVCDYAAMRFEMTSALTDGASDTWFDVDLSWLEWPDIELPSIFDFIDL